jgi:hypothetical protein
MKRHTEYLGVWLVVGAFAVGLAQDSVPVPAPDAEVMLAAVSRDRSMLVGGIGPSRWMAQGSVWVEPLALINSSGDGKSLPCAAGSGKGCVKFARQYLSKPHTYTVISDPRAAVIQGAPATLSECYDFGGKGIYSGAPLQTSGIAASAADLFANSAGLRELNRAETGAVPKSLVALTEMELDSTQEVRLFALSIEGQDMVIVQRAYPDSERRKLIFAIGRIDQGRFHTLYWKKNTEDEQERVLGTVGLKSGRAFLVTAVSDPESQSFRVYGIRNGRLVLIFSGGGSSC